LGQNVNSYRFEQHDFADLMQMVAAVDGIRRVRFTSPHPKDFPRKLLHAMAVNPKLCKHIHLPLQAGSDSVLERMNRTYTKREFLDLVAEIRAIVPEISLTTDVICGFCGEMEEDFEETLDVIRRVEFDSAFTFKYSERKHTTAERKFKDDVPDGVKIQRLTRLIDLQREISQKRNVAEIGKVFEVLVEEPSKKNPHEWLGRTDQNKGVVFWDEAVKSGDFVQVRINAAGTNTLRGTVERQGWRRLPMMPEQAECRAA
jgi:tRNA-2-methylthio-N6-dimethylallyladenosine synthase